MSYCSNCLILHQAAEYALRLANELIWEEDTGFNRLLHTLTVSWLGYLPVIVRD